MSFDFIELKKNIIYWAKTYSGISESGRHIWAYQNSTQPASPYITLNITSGLRKLSTTDSLIFDGNTSSFNVSGPRTFNLDVNVYGKNAFAIANDLAISLENPKVTDFFRSKNLSVFGSTPNVINITELLDTIYEERAMFELIFNTTYCINTDLNYIETVEAQGIDDLQTDIFTIEVGGQ